MRVLRIVSIVIITSLVLSIAGCIYPAIKEEPRMTITPSSPKSSMNHTETQESVYLATPVSSHTMWATASVLPDEIIVPEPGPEEQVYTDPEGWFSVIYPGDLEPTNLENRFSKDNRSIEFGYLPDLGNVAGIDNVCAWIANVYEEDPENWIVDWFDRSDNCSLKTKEELPRQIKHQGISFHIQETQGYFLQVIPLYYDVLVVYKNREPNMALLPPVKSLLTSPYKDLTQLAICIL